MLTPILAPLLILILNGGQLAPVPHYDFEAELGEIHNVLETDERPDLKDPR